MTPPILIRPLPGTVFDPLYPEDDGRPKDETDFHSEARILLRAALKDYFAAAGRSDVYVSSRLMLYYEQGNPASRCAPDILVAKGVSNHSRMIFRVWEEGVTPQVFFEIASESSWREDIGDKRELYARLGVVEYFLFDPEGDWLDPLLQGFRLENGKYVPLIPTPDGRLTSMELGLRLTAEGYMLRLRHLQKGAVVLTRSERANKESARADQERRRADELAKEVARLQALLEKYSRNE